MQEQISMADEAVNPEYAAFIDKFKRKKTTDDCYTPDNVYNAVADWVANEYGIPRTNFVRPFWPDTDYTRFEYPADCVVVDNPPFSILTEIQRFYFSHGIRFFLFAPTLTMMSTRDIDTSYVLAGTTIVYDNGAKVNTSFVTNLEADIRIRTAPSLYEAVYAENRKNEMAQTKQLPKYIYPPEVLTAAAIYSYNRYGIDFRVKKSECAKVHALDAQRKAGKQLFGGAFLLSPRAAAERVAAERTAATVWELSEREREIIKQLAN